MTKPPRRSAFALAVFIAALVTTGVAAAATSTSSIPRNDNRTILVRGIGTVSGSPDGFADVAGAKAVVDVMQGEVLRGTFSTAISCSGPEVATYCMVRMLLVNNTT